MRPILSILIPTIAKRKELFRGLKDSLTYQSNKCSEPIEIIINDDEVLTIGAKRNMLLKGASGKYVCFIDDDDKVVPDYLKCIFMALLSEPDVDCCSLMGQITIDGGPPEIFEHSLRYNEWRTVDGMQYPGVKYERYPNHLNVIKTEIAQRFQFPEINHGEDHKWAEAIHKSGLIKTEAYIRAVLYFYNYISSK